MQYTIVRTARKTIAIQITPDGRVVVRCPKRMSKAAVEQFVVSKRSWIENHLEKRGPMQPSLTERELDALVARARIVFAQRAAWFATLVGVDYGRISIRKQHTRWGSCSRKGNLNFNCLLVLAPEPVLDYVVVHELCHRKQMNHSPAFWAEVERILPDYRQRRDWLKTHGNALISRLPRA